MPSPLAMPALPPLRSHRDSHSTASSLEPDSLRHSAQAIKATAAEVAAAASAAAAKVTAACLRWCAAAFEGGASVRIADLVRCCLQIAAAATSLAAATKQAASDACTAAKNVADSAKASVARYCAALYIYPARCPTSMNKFISTVRGVALPSGLCHCMGQVERAA